MRALVAWAVVLLAAAAFADEGALPADPDLEVARRHFDRGTEFYNQAQYPQAIAEFKAANEARPHPDFDYNIARCYDRLGEWANALAYYRRYLAAVGDAPDTDEARKRVAALTERLRREQPPPAPSAPAPPPKRLRVPAIVVGAAAVVAFAVGGGLYGSAAADFPARKSYCASLPRECVPSEWSDLAARSNAAYALFAIGGALAAADVVLWVIDLKRSRAARAQLSPAANGFVVRF